MLPGNFPSLAFYIHVLFWLSSVPIFPSGIQPAAETLLLPLGPLQSQQPQTWAQKPLTVEGTQNGESPAFPGAKAMRGEGCSENKGCPFRKEEWVCQREGLAVSLQTGFQKSQEVFTCIPPESSPVGLSGVYQEWASPSICHKRGTDSPGTSSWSHED